MPEVAKSDDRWFGPWVYCAQHLRAHKTGWCGVDTQDKIGLGEFSGTHEEQGLAATAKCRRLGLKLYDPSGGK